MSCSWCGVVGLPQIVLPCGHGICNAVCEERLAAWVAAGRGRVCPACEPCAICLEPLIQDYIAVHPRRVTDSGEVMPNHFFHSECIDNFLARGDHRCPVCRQITNRIPALRQAVVQESVWVMRRTVNGESVDNEIAITDNAGNRDLFAPEDSSNFPDFQVPQYIWWFPPLQDWLPMLSIPQYHPWFAEWATWVATHPEFFPYRDNPESFVERRAFVNYSTSRVEFRRATVYQNVVTRSTLYSWNLGIWLSVNNPVPPRDIRFLFYRHHWMRRSFYFIAVFGTYFTYRTVKHLWRLIYPARWLADTLYG